MYKRPETRVVTVASGQTTSDVIDVGDYVVCGVYLPEALTSATAGFSACPTRSGTFQTVRDSDAGAVSFSTNAAGAIGLSGAEADAVAPWKYLKLVTASSEGADRTITLVLKG